MGDEQAKLSPRARSLLVALMTLSASLVLRWVLPRDRDAGAEQQAVEEQRERNEYVAGVLLEQVRAVFDEVGHSALTEREPGSWECRQVADPLTVRVQSYTKTASTLPASYATLQETIAELDGCVRCGPESVEHCEAAREALQRHLAGGR